MTTPIDLDLAAQDYLRSPDGHLRHIRGIRQIVADAQLAGVQAVWDDLEPRLPGYCLWRSGKIVLAAWLWSCPWPFFVRRVLAEEVAHAVVGPSETRAHAWMGKRYGELIEPPECLW